MSSTPAPPGPVPTGHAAHPGLHPRPTKIGKTVPMSLDRNPFVASACEDLAEGRLHTMTAAALAYDSDISEAEATEEHTVTDTFLAMWRTLSFSGTPTRSALLSVMRGIRIEPRHPAYRVAPTGFLNVHQAQVGNNVTLVFRTADDTLVWLAVLHGANRD